MFPRRRIRPTDQAIAQARDSVARRVAAFAKDGIAEIVLDQEATRETRLLFRALRTPMPDAVGTVSNLAWLHWYRAVASPPGRERNDLDRAVVIFGLLSDKSEVEPPAPLSPLLDSGIDLRGGTVRLAQQAVQMCRTVVRTENPTAVLRRATELFELVLAILGEDDPNRPIALNNLAATHDLLYERTCRLADLDATISALKRAASGAPDAEKIRLLSTAGRRLYQRFQRGGDANSDLSACIEVLEQARGLTARNDPELSDLLSELSAAYGSRFTVAGAETDLDVAVTLSRSAVFDHPADDPSLRAKHLSNHAILLMTRYEHAGALDDLDTAIDLLRTAVDEAPQDDVSRGMYLTNLGGALMVRSDPADLDAAVAACTEAVSATPDDDTVHKPGRLSNLAQALATRSSRDQSPDDLRAAIEHSQQALRLAPADHPKRSSYVSNYAYLLVNQWETSRSEDDLELAVRAGRAALAEIPADFPARAKVAKNLGNALLSRASSSHLVVDLYDAMAAYREAAQCTTAAVFDRVLAARLWGDLGVLVDRESAAAGGEAAFDGYELAISLLPLLAWPGTDRTSQEHRLMRLGGIATNAAAAALAAGEQERALMWLEQGRAVLWSRTLEINADLDALRSANPDLMAQLDKVRKELNRLSQPVQATTPDSTLDIAMSLGIDGRGSADQRSSKPRSY